MNALAVAVGVAPFRGLCSLVALHFTYAFGAAFNWNSFLLAASLAGWLNGLTGFWLNGLVQCSVGSFLAQVAWKLDDTQSAQRKQTEIETETETEAKSKTLSRKQFLQTVRQFYSFRVEKENKQTELVRFDLLSTKQGSKEFRWLPVKFINRLHCIQHTYLRLFVIALWFVL